MCNRKKTCLLLLLTLPFGKKVKIKEGYHCVKRVPFSLTSATSTAFHREEPLHEKLKKNVVCLVIDICVHII